MYFGYLNAMSTRVGDKNIYNQSITENQVEAFLMNPTFSSKGGFRIIINGVTIYKVFQDHQDFDFTVL